MQSRKVKKACAVVLAGVIAATTAFAGMPGEEIGRASCRERV